MPNQRVTCSSGLSNFVTVFLRTGTLIGVSFGGIVLREGGGFRVSARRSQIADIQRVSGSSGRRVDISNRERCAFSRRCSDCVRINLDDTVLNRDVIRQRGIGHVIGERAFQFNTGITWRKFEVISRFLAISKHA